jgi:FkbM family methyltransferase
VLTAAARVDRIHTVSAKVWVKVKAFLFDGLLRPERPMTMQRYGTYYAGWWIAEVDPTKGAAICVGAGTDISFDLELHRLGYRVYTVDPTPMAVEHVQQHSNEVTFIPVGVWHESGEVTFTRYRQRDDCWSVDTSESTPTNEAEGTYRLPVLSVKDLIARTNETNIAILKIDIEGAEHAVIASMVRDGIRPACFCVEFDDFGLRKVLASHRTLTQHGYTLMQLENRNLIYRL